MIISKGSQIFYYAFLFNWEHIIDSDPLLILWHSALIKAMKKNPAISKMIRPPQEISWNVLVSKLFWQLTKLIIGWSSTTLQRVSVIFLTDLPLPAGYIIYYSTDVNAEVHDWVVEPVMGNRLTHQVQELTLDTTYYFKIQARNSKGMGPLSDTVQFRTPKGNPVDYSTTLRPL